MDAITLIKVKALPQVLVPSRLYLVKGDNDSAFNFYMTDKVGSVVFSAQAYDQQAANAFISALRNAPGGLAGLDSNRVLSSAIKLNGQDTVIQGPTGDPIWVDMVSQFETITSGKANYPSFGTIYGNFQGLIFEKNLMNQVWADYHINHDIALNTKLYPHVHWMPLTSSAGTVRWGFEYAIAKGHGQQAFGATTTVYVTQSFPANSQYLHMVAEVSDADAILSSRVEPDSFIKMRIFRDATHVLDTYSASVHAWCCDLHYQATRIGTKNKAPNFFN